MDSQKRRPKLTIPNATIEKAEELGETFQQTWIQEKGFNLALDKNLKKIFVLFGSGLKRVYGDKIGEYIANALCWNLEEYSQIQPPHY